MNSGTSNLKTFYSGSPEDNSIIKVMVQDYNGSFLEGFCLMLRDSGFHVTGGARDHNGLMHAFSSQGIPDVILIGYKTQTQETLTMAKEIKSAYPGLKLLLLISPQPHEVIPVDRMKMLGIDGIIDKRHHSILQVKHALITVKNGCSFFD